MLLSKLKIASAVLLATAILSGAAGLAYRTQAGEKAPEAETLAAAPAKPAATNILRNAGFEEGDDGPAHWSQGAAIEGVEYIWDKKVGQRGKASLCLHKTAKRYFPIAQWYQIVDRQGDKPALRVAAQVKAEGVTKAIIDVIFLDEKGEWLEDHGHSWAAYIGAKNANDPPVSHDWKEYTGRVKIPQAAKKIQIALQIYGPGNVWFDEVRAEYTNLSTEKATKTSRKSDEPNRLESAVREAKLARLELVIDILEARVGVLQKNVEALQQRIKRLEKDE